MRSSAPWLLPASELLFFVGGSIASRLSGRPKASTSAWHGPTSRVLTTLVIFYLLTTAGGGLVGGAFNTVSGAIGGVGHAAVLACMRPKRASLTASCREVFDGVVRDVRR